MAIVPAGRTCAGIDAGASRARLRPTERSRRAVAPCRAAGRHPALGAVRRLSGLVAYATTRRPRRRPGQAAFAPGSDISRRTHGGVWPRARRRNLPSCSTCPSTIHGAAIEQDSGAEQPASLFAVRGADLARPARASRRAARAARRELRKRAVSSCRGWCSPGSPIGRRDAAAGATVSISMSIGRDLQPPVGPRSSARAASTDGPSFVVLVVRRRSSCSSSSSRWWSAWRWPSRSPDRSTSCSSAPSACGTATSRTGSRSRRAISSASWPTRSTR